MILEEYKRSWEKIWQVDAPKLPIACDFSSYTVLWFSHYHMDHENYEKRKREKKIEFATHWNFDYTVKGNI